MLALLLVYLLWRFDTLLHLLVFFESNFQIFLALIFFLKKFLNQIWLHFNLLLLLQSLTLEFYNLIPVSCDLLVVRCKLLIIVDYRLFWSILVLYVHIHKRIVYFQWIRLSLCDLKSKFSFHILLILIKLNFLGKI